MTRTRQHARVLLYICPECGDIDCGAYGVQVERDCDRYVWSNFAYESWDEPRLIQLGDPFIFDVVDYEKVMTDATDHFSR
jgi:hypothetical protein